MAANQTSSTVASATLSAATATLSAVTATLSTATATFSTLVSATISTIVSTTRSFPRFFVMGDDTEVYLTSKHVYPLWFYVIIALGVVFCTFSCVVWFLCAIYRLSQERPCTHALYEAHVIVEGATGEQGIKEEKAKHSKKIEALNEAETLAKSFKSLKSKKSSKSSKSAKSAKSAKSGKSSKKSTSKEGKENDEKKEGNGEEKHDEPKSPRNDGGKDSCVLEMGDGN